MKQLLHMADGMYDEYLRDESRSVGWAEGIRFPRSEADVVETLIQAHQERVPLTIQGARTGLAAAAVPHGGYILNLSQMNQVLGLRQSEDGTFYLRVQPGILLSQLNRMLEQKAFSTESWEGSSLQALSRFEANTWIFPPDPTETSASIGGMASCNASGAKTFHYGPTRCYIEALRVVTADGDILSLRRGQYRAEGRNFRLTTLGGAEIQGTLPDYSVPPVKSAAGYYVREDMDLVDLFIGAEGTLGVITELELRLVRKPAERVGVTVFLERQQDALELVRALRSERLPADIAPAPSPPLAIEFFDRRALALLRVQQRTNPAFSQLQPLPDGEQTAVYTEFGAADTQQAMEILFWLGGLLERLGGSEQNTWVALDAEKLEKLRFFRHACPECVNIQVDLCRQKDPRITKLGTDMSVPSACLDETVAMYEQDLRRAGLTFVMFGHIGQNHLHVNVIPQSMEEYDRAKSLYLEWAKRISASGGSVAAEHGIGKLKVPFLKEMYTEEQLKQMIALKALFDPFWLLSPGNIFSSDDTSKAVSA